MMARQLKIHTLLLSMDATSSLMQVFFQRRKILAYLSSRCNPLQSTKFSRKLPPSFLFTHTANTNRRARKEGVNWIHRRRWMEGWSKGTGKVVNGPSRQMMAERGKKEEEGIPFCSSSPTPLATAAPLLDVDVVALEAAGQF